ncbi:transcription factor BIM1-like [Wolffia australiana]
MKNTRSHETCRPALPNPPQSCDFFQKARLDWTKYGYMVAASRSNGGFSGGEDDIFDKGEVKHKVAVRTVKVDVDNSIEQNAEQKPSTPRSKHSATEQRRRTKINDRFRTLRDLIPPSEQKRDKASILLEAIEYIQVLQDKVQKYESWPCPELSHDGPKLTQWGSASREMANFQPLAAGEPIRAREEGICDLSSFYSQRLMERLTGALEAAGLDLTEGNLSVEVKLGKAQTEAPLSARPEKRPKPGPS